MGNFLAGRSTVVERQTCRVTSNMLTTLLTLRSKMLMIACSLCDNTCRGGGGVACQVPFEQLALLHEGWRDVC